MSPVSQLVLAVDAENDEPVVRRRGVLGAVEQRVRVGLPLDGRLGVAGDVGQLEHGGMAGLHSHRAVVGGAGVGERRHVWKH